MAFSLKAYNSWCRRPGANEEINFFIVFIVFRKLLYNEVDFWAQLLIDEGIVMSDSSQSRVGKVRPPRVQITYDVEDGGATESRELPMVSGVISDLSGDSDDPTEYNKREFVGVEQGGVDRFMKRVAPKLKFTVADEISGSEDSEIPVELDFASMDDFSPLGVATQLPQTKKLLEARRQLADLYSKVEANDKLDGILGEVLGDADKQAQLRSELGVDDEGDKDSGEDA